MKNRIRLVLFLFISTVFFGCNSQFCLQKRTSRLIEICQQNTDTVYLYSIAFNDFDIVWYHKDNCLYGFRVNPYYTETFSPIVVKDIILYDDSLNKYFDNFLFKNVQCFENVLDGASVIIYIKNGDTLSSSIDIECLFSSKYKPNSFPYKLQYDFFKLRICPLDFNFEKIYFE